MSSDSKELPTLVARRKRRDMSYDSKEFLALVLRRLSIDVSFNSYPKIFLVGILRRSDVSSDEVKVS